MTELGMPVCHAVTSSIQQSHSDMAAEELGCIKNVPNSGEVDCLGKWKRLT